MSAVAATTHHRKDEASEFGGPRMVSSGRTATNRTKGSTAFATGLQILIRGRWFVHGTNVLRRSWA